MKFSIIVPIYNVEKYLERCVESVRNQTLKNIEIILVENKSQDNSPVLCDEYARRDPRIKVLHLSIAGLSIARNAGLKIASAPYVGFIDIVSIGDFCAIRYIFPRSFTGHCTGKGIHQDGTSDSRFEYQFTIRNASSQG